MGCVYVVRNKANGKRYVGKTSRPLGDRRKNHEHNAVHGSNTAFARALRKYGPDAFDWRVLVDELETNEQRDRAERLWIKLAKTKSPNGYNLTAGGDGGDTISSKTRKEKKQLAARISLSTKGMAKPDGFGKRLSQNWHHNHSLESIVARVETRRSRGIWITDKTKEKIRHSLLGRSHSSETRLKLSVAGRGRKHSVITKAKMSKSGMGHPVSFETREKIRARVLERNRDPAYRRMVREAKVNKQVHKHAEEAMADG